MEVSDQIIQVLNYFGEKVGISIDWTSENVMPYIQELCIKYITYEIATSIMWVVISLTIFITMKKLCIKLLDVDDGLFMIFSPFCVFVGIITVIIVICQINDLLRCMIVPELEIYNTIQELI